MRRSGERLPHREIMIVPHGFIEAVLATNRMRSSPPTTAASLTSGILAPIGSTGESHYGHGDLLSVPALTKSARRISVEFTIVMLKTGAIA